MSSPRTATMFPSRQICNYWQPKMCRKLWITWNVFETLCENESCKRIKVLPRQPSLSRKSTKALMSKVNLHPVERAHTLFKNFSLWGKIKYCKNFNFFMKMKILFSEAENGSNSREQSTLQVKLYCGKTYDGDHLNIVRAYSTFIHKFQKRISSNIHQNYQLRLQKID